MHTIHELNTLRNLVEARKHIHGVQALAPAAILEIIDQAIADRTTINKWFGFLKLMASRSSWGEKINEVLNEYLFGTENKAVQIAAKRYVETVKLHERGINQ